MKRVLAFAIVFFIILSSFGCGKKDVTDNKTGEETKQSDEGSKSSEESKNTDEDAKNDDPTYEDTDVDEDDGEKEQYIDDDMADENTESSSDDNKSGEDDEQSSEDKKSSEGDEQSSEDKKTSEGDEQSSEEKKSSEGGEKASEDEKSSEGGEESSEKSEESGKSEQPSEKKTIETATLAELDQATREKAVQEIMLAYYYKNPYFQYESGRLTVEKMQTGVPYRTTYLRLENIGWDEMGFAQCAEYSFDVYWSLCGYEFMGDRNLYGNRVYEEKFRDSIVAGYDKTHPELGLTDQTKAVNFVKNECRPGDIILSYGTLGGHVMMILGDIYGDGVQYALHCWPVNGGKLDLDTGEQKHEPNGAIALQTVEELLLSENGTPNWPIINSKGNSRWYVFRPLNIKECNSLKLSKEAIGRLHYNRIGIDKRANISVYDSIVQGENITVTEKITNNSKEAYKDLKIVEYVPSGATFVSADSACTRNGSTLSWTLNIPAGGSATITYTVKNTLGAGKTLKFEAGLIDVMPSRNFELKVGYKKLSESQNKVLSEIAKNGLPSTFKVSSYMDVDFINKFYSELLGIDLNLPKTMKDLVNTCFEVKLDADDNINMLYTKQTTAANAVFNMVLPKHIGGQYVNIGTDSLKRVMEIREEYYEVGDIFLSFGAGNTATNKTAPVDNSDTELYIYLGSGRVLKYSVKGAEVVSFVGNADTLLAKSCFIVIRPSLTKDCEKTVTVPVYKTAKTCSTFAQLKAAANGTNSVIISGNITLTENLIDGVDKLTIAAGKTLTLGNYKIACKELVIESGATLNGDSGRIVIKTDMEATIKDTLKAFEGKPVSLEYTVEDYDNTYDCKTRIGGFYNNGSTTKNKNLKQLLTVLPEGWTIQLHTGYISNMVLNFPYKNLTIDLNGYSLGFRNYTGESIKVVNSVPSKGNLYFRGAANGQSDTISTTIDATGLTVILGWSTTNIANIVVNGKLICKEIKYNNGSTITMGTGTIEYK